MSEQAQLVLASKSPARYTTLRNAGVNPLVVVSTVDEDAVAAALPPDASPARLVCALAEAKALSVAHRLVRAWEQPGIDPDASSVTADLTGAPSARQYLVLGCDSMLEINRRMVGKPHTAEVARQRIQDMRGTDATLWTGHSLVVVEHTDRWSVGKVDTRAASTIVHFGDISDEEIEAYVRTGEPLNVAGSFTIDGFGGPFVRGVTGDPHSVVGVSWPLLRDLVKQAGVFWPDLWETQA